jgi:hypothetical protein
VIHLPKLRSVEGSDRTSFLARRNMGARWTSAEMEKLERAGMDRQTAESIRQWSGYGSSRSLLVAGKSTMGYTVAMEKKGYEWSESD